MTPGVTQNAYRPVAQGSATGGSARTDCAGPPLALPRDPDSLHFEAIMRLLDRHGWHAAVLSHVLPNLMRHLPANEGARRAWLRALGEHWPQLARDMSTDLPNGAAKHAADDCGPAGLAWNLGVLFGSLQCWRLAATCFALWQAAGGRHHGALHNLAVSHWQLAEHEVAQRFMQDACAAAPGNDAYRRQLATMRAWRHTCRALLGGDRMLAYPVSTGTAAGRLHATLLGPHHAGALLRQQDDQELVRLARLEPLRTVAQARAWICAELDVPGKITLALMHGDDGLAGVAALHCDGDAASFYVWIGREHQGGGGRTALRLLKRLALKHGIRHLYSPVLEENRRSASLLLRAGYRPLAGVVEDKPMGAPYYALTLTATGSFDEDAHFKRLSALLATTGGHAVRRAVWPGMTSAVTDKQEASEP